MIRVNLLNTDIDIKIVITGPEQSGKTSIITYLYLNIKRKFRSSLTSYSNLVGRTLFFDHLRILYGRVGNRRLILNIFTVPGAPTLSSRRKDLLYLSDAVIFVFNSNKKARLKSLRSRLEMTGTLRSFGIKPSRFPIAYFDHKSEPQVSSPGRFGGLLRRLIKAFIWFFGIFRSWLGQPYGPPVFYGSAYEGWGVLEALDGVVGLTLNRRGEKQIKRFNIRTEVPVTMDEFDDIFKRYHIRRAAFEYDSYVSLGRKVIRIDPSEKGFLLALSDAFEREGRHDKARKYRLWAIRSKEDEGGGINFRVVDDQKLNPIYVFERTRYLAAARKFMEEGETKKAINAVRDAASATQDPYKVLMLLKTLAEMKIRVGKTKEGLNSLTRLAGRFISQGYYKQALSLYYYVLRHRPNSLDCLLGAGRALEEMDRIADALEFLQRAKDVMSEGRIFVGRSDVAKRTAILKKKMMILKRARDGG